MEVGEIDRKMAGRESARVERGKKNGTGDPFRTPDNEGLGGLKSLFLLCPKAEALLKIL